MQILVLGGNGYVGSHICKEALRQGFSVSSLSRFVVLNLIVVHRPSLHNFSSLLLGQEDLLCMIHGSMM